MKIVYLILIHNNLEQVEYQIKSLNHPESRFILHIDKKVEYNHLKKYFFFSNPKVLILKRRFNISWGGFNMVKAMLSLIKEALKLKEKAYFVVISGSDFPIKSPDFIYAQLKRDYGKQYLNFFALPDSRWPMNGGLDRIRYFWLVDKIGLANSHSYYSFQKQSGKTREYFEGFPPFGGSQWWCITEECAKFIIGFNKYNKIYEDYFELTFIPDETFFNTLILNSPFARDCINDNLRYIDWSQKGSHPKSLQLEDIPKLISSNALWARKIESMQVLIGLQLALSNASQERKSSPTNTNALT